MSAKIVKKLTLKKFLESFKLSPRVAINILVKNSSDEILLAKRSIPPLKGSWHIPGSFLLKDETLTDCMKRVAREELGLNIKSSDTKLLGVFEDLDQDPRGHIIDIVYEIQLTNSTNITPGKTNQEIAFFKNLPKKIGFNHKETLQKLGVV